MIWEATVSMTVIDVLIIGAMVASIWALLTNKKRLQRANAMRGAMVLVCGLVLIGLFCLVDLFTMVGLPVLADPETALSVMADLHLNYSWGVVLLSSFCVLVGLILMNKNVFALLSQTEKSEAKFQDLYEHAPDPSVSVHPESGNILECNQMAATYFGYTKEELIGKSVFDLYHPDSLEAARRAFKTFVPTGNVQDAELQVRRKDGKTRDVTLNVTAVRDAQGTILKSRSVWRDVTKLTMAQRRLQEREAHFRTLIEHSPFCIHEISLDGRLLSMNSAGLQMLSLEKEQEVKGRKVSDFVAPQDKSRIETLFQKALAGHSSRFEFQTTNGLYFESCFVPIKRADGTVDKIMGLTQDLTRRKHIEDLLRTLMEGTTAMGRKEDFFKKLVEKMVQALGVRFALVTELVSGQPVRLRSLAGWQDEPLPTTIEYEATNTPCEFVLKEGAAYYPQGVRDLFPHDEELQILKAESYLGLRLTGKSGAPLGHVCIVHDHPLEDVEHAQHILTIFASRAAAELGRMAAEEETSRTLEQLRHLTMQLSAAQEQERKRIAQELHDEFGQALTGLNFDLSWTIKHMSKEGTLNRLPKLREKLQGMSSNVVGIIQSMRRIASSLHPSILDDLGLAEALECEFREFHERTGIRCRVKIEEAMKGKVVHGEAATALYRISQEFLTNVIKHAGASQVTLSLKKTDEILSMELTDNGKGILPSHVASRGSLGLLGMKERARSLGGEFHISGEPGRGTVVLVTLPLQGQKHVSQTVLV